MNKKNRELIWLKYNKKCAYCGSELAYKDMQVDHIEPKFNGGKDLETNYNPSCRACNFYKGTFSIDGFREQLTTLHERFGKIFIVKLALKYGILKHVKFDGKFYFEKVNDNKYVDDLVNQIVGEK